MRCLQLFVVPRRLSGPVFQSLPLDGTVVKIDEGQEITLRHGPIKKFPDGRRHDHGFLAQSPRCSSR
jgi:hypothetical protein